MRFPRFEAALAVLLCLAVLASGTIVGGPGDRARTVVTEAPRAASLAAATSRPMGRPTVFGHSTGTSPNPVSGLSVVGTAPTYDAPVSAATDLANGYVYVSNYGAIYLGGNTESVISPSNETMVADLGSGDDPISSLYDPADQDVYVANYGATNNVSIYHGLACIANPATGLSPHWGVYDPADEEVYMGNTKSANVSVLNGTAVVASIPVGSDPEASAYDPADQYVYVPNAGSNNVSVISGSSLVASIPVGTQPTYVAYDAANGDVYVVNALSDNVTVINGTSVVGWVPVGLAPLSAVYDPADGSVYVIDGGSNSVHVVQGLTVLANVSVGDYPRYGAYDASDGNVYVAEWASNDLAVLNGTALLAYVAVGGNPYTVAYDPLDDEIDAPNFADHNLSQVGQPTGTGNLTVNETGAPAGLPWQLNISATGYVIQGAGAVIPLTPASYRYSVLPPIGYRALNGSGSVTVGSGSSSLTIRFEAVYNVTFQETGVLAGDAWTVTVSNSTGPVANLTGFAVDLSVALPNGSYSYLPARLSGYFVPAGGNVTVLGAPATIDLAYTAILYRVSFDAEGLPAGTAWSVDVANASHGSTGSTISVELPNGTYAYSVAPLAGYRPRVPVGLVDVLGANRTLAIPFNRTYQVSFHEVGLPLYSYWSVDLNGSRNRTYLATVGFTLINGTYPYVVATQVPGWGVPNASGRIRVAGASLALTENFTNLGLNATPYSVPFLAVGLPAGALWNVTFGNTEYQGRGAEVTAWAANGSVDFSVQSYGFRPDPSGGSLTIRGDHAPILVRFAPWPIAHFAVSVTPAGLAAGTPWNLSVNGTVLGGVGGTSLNLSLANGTYAYAVGAPSGYAVHRNGSFSVNGGRVAVSLTFVPWRYPVVFRESGLPPGTSWRVTLSGTTNASLTTEVSIWAANGSYGYAVPAVPGFAVPARGSVVIDGSAPPVIPVPFVPAVVSNSSNGSAASGIVLDPPLEATIGIAVAGIVGVLAVWFVPLRRAAMRGDVPRP